MNRATNAEIVRNILGDVPLPAIRNALFLIGVDPSGEPPEPRWSCGVVRSGYHNGAGCRPDDPHGGWGCGWRSEIVSPATYTETHVRAWQR